MKTSAILLLVVFVSGCGAETKELPPFEDIQDAVVSHARCIDGAVNRLDLSSGTEDEMVSVVRNECSDEREMALRLKAVPVFEKTVADYDETQDGLARSLIATRRRARADD